MRESLENQEVRPVRIQRKRTKGWRMPEGAVYVGRPTIFGNPFPLIPGGTREGVCNMFRRWLADGERATGGGGLRRIVVLSRVRSLHGKDLACWCPLNQPCHADVLLELANPTALPETEAPNPHEETL